MRDWFNGTSVVQHDAEHQGSSQKASLLLLALIAATGTAIWLNRPQVADDQMEAVRPGLDLVNFWANNLAQSQVAPLELAIPGGWKTNQVATGVISYGAPAAEVETIAPEETAATLPDSIARLDGTRFPYVSEVSSTELLKNQVSPGVYQWKDTWQGEGYSRERNRYGNLVSEREGGVDIDVTVVYDSNIKDPTKPNLMIMVQNNQDETGQLTNLSAFLNDPDTGSAIARRDFEQLPPVYDVILTKNGGFGGVETKVLDRLGTVTFSYHVTPEQIKKQVPFKLQGNNHYFDERQQEFYDLQAQGWEIREVPPR
jgi:hypothetical protein